MGLLKNLEMSGWRAAAAGGRATAQEAAKYEELRTKVEQDLNARRGHWGAEGRSYQWGVVGKIKPHQLASKIMRRRRYTWLKHRICEAIHCTAQDISQLVLSVVVKKAVYVFVSKHKAVVLLLQIQTTTGETTNIYLHPGMGPPKAWERHGNGLRNTRTGNDIQVAVDIAEILKLTEQELGVPPNGTQWLPPNGYGKYKDRK